MLGGIITQVLFSRSGVPLPVAAVIAIAAVAVLVWQSSAPSYGPCGTGRRRCS